MASVLGVRPVRPVTTGATEAAAPAAAPTATGRTAAMMIGMTGMIGSQITPKAAKAAKAAKTIGMIQITPKAAKAAKAAKTLGSQSQAQAPRNVNGANRRRTCCRLILFDTSRLPGHALAAPAITDGKLASSMRHRANICQMRSCKDILLKSIVLQKKRLLPGKANPETKNKLDKQPNKPNKPTNKHKNT